MAELTYTRVGDYLIPDLMLDGEDETEEYPLGKYGMLRETFLKKHHHGTYTSMLLSGRLEPHLREIDRQAQEQVDRTARRFCVRRTSGGCGTTGSYGTSCRSIQTVSHRRGTD